MKNTKYQKRFILKELSKWKKLYCSSEEEWKRMTSFAVEKLQEAFGDDLEAKLKWLRRSGQTLMKDPGACLDGPYGKLIV